MSWGRSALLHALPSSKTTLSKYVNKRLDTRKLELTALLGNAQSKISISVDVWTSSNYISFLGVVAHFADASYKQRDVLIAFRDLHGDHTGDRQAGVILNVMREFDFTRNFNCFVGDNASSNHSTLIRGLGLEPHHRIRCAGHIINLVVKATLYGNGVSKFEEDLAKAAPLEQFKLYRSRGVIGKLHNFVTAVCGSHKRRELFKSVYKDLDDEDPFWSFVNLQLVKDGGVRWHSVYLMLLRCWIYESLLAASNEHITLLRNVTAVQVSGSK